MNKLARRVLSAVSPEFRTLDVARRNSLCGRERLRGIRTVAEAAAARRLPGAFIECGVFRGGSAAVITRQLRRTNPRIEVHLFDVFTGMPRPGPNDPPEAWEDVGKFKSSEQIVRETFTLAGLSLSGVDFHVGMYEETLPSFTPPPIAFLHLDCDWYDSLKLCLHTFYDRVAEGGTILLDDYGHWSGCRKAVDEFLGGRGIMPTLTPIDYTSHYFVKPPAGSGR